MTTSSVSGPAASERCLSPKMNILIINIASFIMSESVTNAKNILIYNRKLNDDVRNGHAKPTEAKRQVSSWHIINKKSAPRSNKYFVTWRPDLRDEQEQNKTLWVPAGTIW